MNATALSRPSFVRYWVPVLIYLALIYLLSSGSFHLGLFNKAQKSHADKIVHVVEYAFLGFLLARAMGKYTFFRQSMRVLAAIVLLAGLVYGISDELHQMTVPNRSADFTDVIADGIGVFIGVFIYYKKRFKRICPK